MAVPDTVANSTRTHWLVGIVVAVIATDLDHCYRAALAVT